MGNTPNVRFKGFTEDWEQRKLGDVAQEFKSGNSLKADEIDITGDYPVYGGNGLRGYTSTYNHDGEYALIGRQGALCGNMNYSVGKAYFTEHAVVVKADENNDTRYLYYMLDTMNLGQYSDQSAQPGLAVNKLVKLENRFPAKEEQQRIGWYFRNMDHLITLHQQKCDETKEFKKYMLQNMFPQKDEKVPKIRFDGFTGDWEQRKLGELGKIMTGSTPSTSKSEYYSEEGIPWVTPTDINALTISDTPRKLSEKGMKVGRVVPANTILCTCIASIGKNALLTVKGSFNQQINSLTPSAENDSYFLLTESELWSKKMKRMAASGTMQIVNKTEFSELDTMVPSLGEQKIIGSYFRNLDNLITLHQQKCNALKEFKKYMLQNMFPQKGENKCQN